MTTNTEPMTSGDNPVSLQVTLAMSSYAQLRAFYEWVASGDCAQAFSRWCITTRRQQF